MHNICTAFIYNIEFLCILYAKSSNYHYTMCFCVISILITHNIHSLKKFFDIWWRCFEDEDFDVQDF